MTDPEILDKYIDLESSCLSKEEKKEVMEMSYKYRKTFSLRDENGTCPNIEVEIDVMDRSPFFIRPYHVKEEDEALIDKEMKRLCYLGILKEGYTPYSSLVMLSVLGSSKCEVLSVLDLEDTFHSLQLSENYRKYYGILPYFGSTSYLYERMPMGLNISCISAILDCLQSKKYCEAIMDDLLLFTPSRESHMAKLEDLLKALLKNGLKISPKKCQLFRTNLHYLGNEIFIQNKRVCVKPLNGTLEAV